MSLHPTPTRLALLDEVRVGNVILALDPDTGIRPTAAAMLQTSGDQPGRRVAAAIEEMERAGWVERPDRTAAWQLTDAGREVLDSQATRYRVEFARVGRKHDVAPFGPVVSGPDHADQIAAAVYRYAGRHLLSGSFGVDIDLAAGKGWIEGGRYGTFTVTRVGVE